MVRTWLYHCLTLLMLFTSSTCLKTGSSDYQKTSYAVLNEVMLQVNPPPSSSPSSSSSSNGKVVKTVVVTAVITLLIAWIFFLCYLRYVKKCRQKSRNDPSVKLEEAAMAPEEFKNVGLKGHKEHNRSPKVLLSLSSEEEKRVDLISEKTRKCEVSQEVSIPSPSTKKVLALPPPPPPQPPPPPPPPKMKVPAPPPPPFPARAFVSRSITKPQSPVPTRGSSLVSSVKPPPVPKGRTNNNNSKELGSMEVSRTGIGNLPNTKLKPLYWDKVIANADHSMVWDQINDSSLRFDDEMIETLFGYTTANSKNAPQRNGVLSSSGISNTASTAQIFILEPRKSQNTAIVLKSLGTSRKEILDSLIEGHGLTTDVLEKLARVSPSKDEAAKILQFNGDPAKLADAECFLYHILKAVPSAFTRINAMLFRSNYDAEILHLKESLQTLELGCKELRTRGIFLKLLEAILKAGNKMNAGTSRGNAQGFNLAALRKLSDVKSTDGKTTLLHFVVEQVIRSEGKRYMVNTNQSQYHKDNMLKRINSSANSDMNPEERNREYLLLGLPVLGGLSVEFLNVKKAAAVEYESFTKTCSNLSTRVAETRKMMITACGSGEGGEFVSGMRGFLEECEEEIKVVREEEERIMELVKRTTEYYQAESLKNNKEENPLHIFGIVKDFLDMVERVSVDISRKAQKKNKAATGSTIAVEASSSPPSSPPRRRHQVRFQDFRVQLLSDKSRTPSSSDSSDDDF